VNASKFERTYNFQEFKNISMKVTSFLLPKTFLLRLKAGFFNYWVFRKASYQNFEKIYILSSKLSL